MEQSIKNSILRSIGNIYDRAKGCKLGDDFFEQVEPDLRLLSEYFDTNNSQSLLVAMVFSLNYKGDTVDFKGLIEYFDCNPIKLLEYSSDFNNLYTKGIFIKEKLDHRINVAISNYQFSVSEKVTEAILNSMPLPQLREEVANDIIELLEKIYELGLQRDEDEISTESFFDQIMILIKNNLHYPLIKIADDFNFDIEDTYLYLYLIWKTLNGYESVDIERTTSGIFENRTRKIKYIQKIISSENDLIRHNLIEIIETRFHNDIEIKLTEKSCKLIEDCGLKLLTKRKVNQNNIIEPTKIFEKKLYFNDTETKQLEIIKRLLLNENFKELQNRLEQKGFPKGITALLYGRPGTGKTETVFQIARETNREIVKVDISQSKSMWFGESEKIIKRIFTNYKSYAKDCELKPILLFNEADAIFGKRKEIGNSNVDQTENTIQNILLEELENFDGIFLATTNLVRNLDSAFERRFLFKVEFQKPEVSIKAKIWSSKLPALTEDECNTLASYFDFSGGQIDNIIRKNEIYEIVHGITVDFNNIVEFCNSELLLKNNSVKVGFTKS